MSTKEAVTVSVQAACCLKRETHHILLYKEERNLKKLCITLAFVFVCASAPMLVFAGDGSLSGRVIVLDPGHGVGAQGGGAYAGYVEHVRMLFLGQLIRAELESRGATVHMTRTTFEDVYITLRPAMTNRWSLEALRLDRVERLNYENISESERYRLYAEISELDDSLGVIDMVLRSPDFAAREFMNYPFDHEHRTAIHPSWRRIFEFQDDPLIRYNWLFISLHSNATPHPINHAVNGADVFYMPNAFYFANYAHQDLERMFGEMLLDNIAPLGIRRNSVRPAHFLVVRETNIPAVLVENGYHTNERDRALLSCNDFMQSLAIVYADTIEAYFAAIYQNRHHRVLNAPVTRGDLARFAVLTYESIRGHDIYGRVFFSDTNSVYAQKAAYIGIMGGVGNNIFMPNQQITREQAAVVLSRLAAVLGSPLPPSSPDFIDYARISAWAAPYVGQAQAAGLMAAREFNFFVPHDILTMEQAEIAFGRLENMFSRPY